ncbi:DUF6011 domain-containing protein [Streptomyces sp. NPDC005385]|uniref:DUF6011 domain-containing protein n=1 Tax=Streptomyces sp. NPDC005385 TaxID=3157039 RepID=UPI0033BEE5E4
MSTECGRCGRVLTSEASVRRGYGRACMAKLRTAEESVASQYKPHQVSSAHELIEDVAIVQIKPRIYRSVSSDGTHTYLTALTGNCNCPAGLRGSACYHGLAARILSLAA